MASHDQTCPTKELGQRGLDLKQQNRRSVSNGNINICCDEFPRSSRATLAGNPADLTETRGP